MGRSRRQRAITTGPTRGNTAVVAAAAPISLDGTGWKSWKLGDQRWQEEAWRHLDICGELRFATNWMASAISRCRLYVAELDKFGRPSKETNDEQLQILAESMFGGPTLKAEAQRSIGAQLYISGESFIIAEDVAVASKDIWYVCSSSEVHRTGTTQVEVMRSHLYGGGRHQLRPGRDLMLRVWTPHPRRYDAPDSSVRSVLPVLREIEQLTKKVFAQIDSRLAGAGLMFVPQEMDLPPTKDGLPGGAAGLARRIERAIAASLQDQSAASSLAPIIVQVAGEFVDKIKWQTFETPFSAETESKLTGAIRRLATGLDIPPEILLGQGDSNHWSAWQIEESTIKIQVEPALVRICDALTNGYLKPALKVLGKDPDAYVVHYDTAPLAVRPNRQADAITLYGLGPDMISAEEVRKAGDWGEGAAPKKKEYERRLAEDLVKLNPALISNADIQKALGIDWDIEDPNAMPPAEQLPPDEQWVPEEQQSWGPPAFPDVDAGTPAQEAALLVGADHIVRRALERAGGRLLTRSRRSSGEFANVPAAELHTFVAVPAEEMDRLIGDAFTPVAELAERVGMDAEVVADMLTVYTTALIARSEPHNYTLFAAYVTQALDLIGHGSCGEFCRNPLHPGPCAGLKGPPTRSHRGDRVPDEGGGSGDRKLRAVPPPRAVRAEVRDGPLDPERAADAAVDLQRAVEGDNKARERVSALARELYDFEDPETGLHTEVTSVRPAQGIAHRGAGIVIDMRIRDAEGNDVGFAKRTLRSDPATGRMTARHASMELEEDVQGGGFGRRFNEQAYAGYRQMGVPHVTLTADDTVGGAAWAAQGFDWLEDADARDMARRFSTGIQSLQDGPIKTEVQALLARATPEGWAQGTFPSPYEFYMLGAEHPRERRLPSGRMTQTWFGREQMLGSMWEGVLRLESPRPGSGPVTAAAKPEDAIDAWAERQQFLDAVHQLDLEWADEVAEDVPAYADEFDPPGGEKVNDYPEHHHLFSADAEDASDYLARNADLMAQWGRGREEQAAVVAHASCTIGQFCLNPPHPGPCKGWRDQIHVAPIRRRDQESDDELPRRKPRRLPPPDLTEDEARVRQERINQGRRPGQLLTLLARDIAEADGKASPNLVRFAIESSGLPERDRDHLKALLPDVGAVYAAVRRMAADQGVHMAGRPGDTEPYDPSIHNLGGGEHAEPGHPIEIERPGLTIDLPGEERQVLERALVYPLKTENTSGVDTSGMVTMGWSPEDPLVAEIARYAAEAGFTAIRADPEAGGWAAVDVWTPDADTMLIGHRRNWDKTLEEFRAEAAAAKLKPVAAFPHHYQPSDGHYFMPEALGVTSMAEYVAKHEGGHRDALLRGQLHTPTSKQDNYFGYDVMGAVLADWFNEQGVRWGIAYDPADGKTPVTLPPDVADPGEGSTAWYLVNGREWTPEQFTTFLTHEQKLLLADHGISEYGLSNPTEMYAELYVSFKLGSDSELVGRVAEAYGWTR